MSSENMTSLPFGRTIVVARKRTGRYSVLHGLWEIKWGL